MEKVTVIACYNREDILESMLKQSISEQKDVECELLFYNGVYNSAAETFNHAIKEATSEYLIFVHQDIRFEDEYAIKNIVESICEEPKALYGICGSVRTDAGYKVYSSVFHGIWQIHVGIDAAEKIKVDGLDEVLVACHKDVFNEISFDEVNFDGWHMYVADLCCQAGIKDIPVYVIPIKSVHKNHMELRGYFYKYMILPWDYFPYLKRIWKKYKKSLSYISSPCANFKTNSLSFYRYYSKRKFITFYRNIFRRLSIK